ncbi:MAG: L-serine ammonia-lyase, iron-sulfur-dependent, subunit alpha [Limnochordales bacterium]|nr:L-serine ammonia-lyase, iron-sulfur-dependent, subunit alpha [Limnochordales bacterium]
MQSLQELIAEATARGVTLADLALEYEARESGVDPRKLLQRMGERLQVMRASVAEGARPGLRSYSGLTGPLGHKLLAHLAAARSGEKPLLSGTSTFLAASRATAVMCVNAAMGRVVATPTAGSAGIVPAVLLTVAETLEADDEAVIRALFTAGIIGLVIANRASISGAAGGCQAEVGAAAGMAAGAAVELAGGSPEAAGAAVALTLQNALGLPCDPVAGLVEIPCVYRNAAFAAVALTMADLALAGIRSPIPVDEVIDVMGQLGRHLPAELRETGRGGLAATPTGIRLARQVEWREYRSER